MSAKSYTSATNFLILGLVAIICICGALQVQEGEDGFNHRKLYSIKSVESILDKRRNKSSLTIDMNQPQVIEQINISAQLSKSNATDYHP